MDTWSGVAKTSWCTTRICEGSAAEVAALLHGYSAGRTRLTVGSASLTLDAGGATADGVATVAVPRVRTARLRYARWLPPARVTVEVEPWSRDRSEMVIRPARRLPPGAAAYLEAAARLLEALVTDLGVDWVRRGDEVAVPVGPLRRAS